MWVAGSVLLIAVTLAIIIQIPSVQNFIVSKAVNIISEKTHSKISIDNIAITFPKNVLIKGLYVGDQQDDTLLAVRKITVNTDLFRLIKGDIIFQSIGIEGLTGFVSRSENDSLFNFNFIIEAFADSSKQNTKDTTREKTEFAINKVELDDIHLRLKDQYTGMNALIDLEHLKLRINKNNLKELKFDVEELLVDGLNGTLSISSHADKDTVEKIMPYFRAGRIEILNSTFVFSDYATGNYVNADLETFTLTNGMLDLTEETGSAEDIQIDRSAIKITSFASKDSAPDKPGSSKSNWKFRLDEIELKENIFSYNILNKSYLINSFDPAHITLNKINLSATSLVYSSSQTKADVSEFSFIEKNGFTLSKLEGKLGLNETSATLKDFIVETSRSKIDGNFMIGFNSLQTIGDSIKNLHVMAEIENAYILGSDILFFQPELIKQPFFKNSAAYLSVNGKIAGQISNLKGQHVNIRTGTKTSITTDFIIKGLPEFKTSHFTIPYIEIRTGRADIVSLAGNSALPDNIALPENIRLKGKFTGRLRAFHTILLVDSDFGSFTASGNIESDSTFRGNVNIKNFDAGMLLKNREMFGPVTANVEASGKGFTKETIQATIKLQSPSFYLNRYNYHDLLVEGNIADQFFNGKLCLNDSNAVLSFDGMVSLIPGEEHYKFNLDLEGADLLKLNIAKQDLKISAKAVSDLKGKDMNTISGKIGVTQIIVYQKGEMYRLDSLVYVSVNEKGKSEMNLTSAIIGVKYKGTFAPGKLVQEIKNHINKFFPIGEYEYVDEGPQKFELEIEIHNHPVLSEVFFTKLTAFEPGKMTASFNGETNVLIADLNITKLAYSGFDVSELNFNINSDVNAFNFRLSAENISGPSVRLTNLTAAGNLKEKKIHFALSTADEDGNENMLVRTVIEKSDGDLKVMLAENIIIGKTNWKVPSDNYFLTGNEGLLFHNLVLNSDSKEIRFESLQQNRRESNITIRNFELIDLSMIVKKDEILAEGKLDAEIILKKPDTLLLMSGDMSIDNLKFRSIPLGNLAIKADNHTGDQITFSSTLSGELNNFTLEGKLYASDTTGSFDAKINLTKLSVKTIEAFSMGNITNGKGDIKGQLIIQGKAGFPHVTGELVLDNVHIRPKVINSGLSFRNEKITFRGESISLSNFTAYDENGEQAIINGELFIRKDANMKFDINVESDNFQVLNTTSKNNEIYYGTLIIDSRISVTGTSDFPVIESRIKLMEGSNFTFEVPKKELSTDRGEGIIVFTDSVLLHPILTRNSETEQERSEIKGFEIASTIETDPKAVLRLLIDPTTNDSLVVQGDAALSFRLDPSGKVSLTGTYALTDGSYLVSLKSLVRKRFNIEPGSTITWNGDPLDAELNINAIYTIRTSPIDLVADQLSGLTDADRNAYRQRLTFLVYLKLKGLLLHPDISFEIQLPPEDKGAFNGAVNARLNQLNENPSLLNKQVFALLVLGRFVQENPLESAGGGVALASVARNSVSSLLTAQLNQWGSRFIEGVELNFDVQSYDDYTSGQAEGRTELGIGVRKELFDERLSIQVGGTVDVEGEKAKQNNVSDITGDVTLEYKITEDGRYRLKGYRENVYDDPIEGEVTETGAGILYTRDFEKWKELFKPPAKKKDEGTRRKK